MNLKGKQIILGVTGSIAAYKAAFLVRLLIKEGAAVQVILSPAALDFCSPLTLATLSRRPVLYAFYKNDTGEWNNHVELGLWADLILIAPLTANSLAKMAGGYCDNLLLATYLSARCPVWVAPAMDLDMYRHPAIGTNLQTLQAQGVHVLDAESGELASGLEGQGRMMEPAHILRQLYTFFESRNDFKGKKVGITMGPTQEALDPVRFVSNHSSGKMGYALAEAFLERGAEVWVIAGPLAIPVEKTKFHWEDVRSAAEMYQASKKIHPKLDLMVFAAAVADYAPAQVATEKIKKEGDRLEIHLKKNIDIAEQLGQQKNMHQFHVGFALETEKGDEQAKEKLIRKNFDLIVLNSLKEKGAGFRLDTNHVRIYSKQGIVLASEIAPKSIIAHQILDQIKKETNWTLV